MLYWLVFSSLQAVVSGQMFRQDAADINTSGSSSSCSNMFVDGVLKTNTNPCLFPLSSTIFGKKDLEWVGGGGGGGDVLRWCGCFMC